LLTSCSKVPKCWECTRTTSYPSHYLNSEPNVTTFQLCDKTKLEMKEIVNNSTFNNIDNYGSSIVTECH
jgi:hypothetical protein